jgi:glycosyltransferase involved in cell wall biosynthesis
MQQNGAPLGILVDSFADAGLTNAQMGNAREIVARLDPQLFHITMFVLGQPDARLLARRNTSLIRLPARRQTVRILHEFVCGDHEILFYLKAAPASRWYMSLRKKWRDRRVTVGTVESQSDVKNEPTITPEAVRLWEQSVLRCDHLFSNSRSVRNSLEREYGLASDIVPTGVDTRFFTPSKKRPESSRLQVLFAGSLRPFKQPQLLIDAAALFPQADFRVAGDGPLAPELRFQIGQRQLRNITLLGPLTAEELRQEYQRADIFLFPSKWEGSPKVLLEAAACALPVIARNDYTPETVLQGITGYTANSNEQIFQYLEILLSNAELRQVMGRNARRLSEKYDWDVVARRWEHIFLRLASQKFAAKAS